jgi:hypothetical protein
MHRSQLTDGFVSQRTVERNHRPQNKLSSRPERSEVEGPAVDSSSIKYKWKRPLPFVIPSGHGPLGPPKVMKNTFCLATALQGSAALPFVIPSAAEGSAVPRTSLGNVFRRSEADGICRFSPPASNPNGSATPCVKSRIFSGPKTGNLFDVGQVLPNRIS